MTTTHPGRALFVNLPVADHATVMLLQRERFAEFSHRPLAAGA